MDRSNVGRRPLCDAMKIAIMAWLEWQHTSATISVRLHSNLCNGVNRMTRQARFRSSPPACAADEALRVVL